ncbi:MULTISPECIES: efflux RND transporter periplasmic adaptor subunit [Stenotrophomonas]|jgi:multidrug efflux system membrane fusion protein|uniref:Efflux RND transporter periplasmic adaptor subunit n=2 Tax=Gammaproteobacteria TaxID=1236 RepID=A0ABU9JNG4_9GAMM|nr:MULTISPECIES: efflux RND transporter periplasmic adaptor subunit [Stenotrophomonas]MCX2918822.1 efflux RND transporter periplasmic adaptor subunit [Stenotrophomonas rhizophila]OFS93231.1 efflux transporter periplasmic adaptor subunit [Stenotrophomonas sp. HMSC10F06]
MSRFWKIVLLVVAVLVVAVVGVRLMGGKKGDAAGPAAEGRQGGDPANAGPVPVTVIEAARQDVPVYASALGTVAAMNTVTVSPQVGGQLISLNFKEGQEVKKGDLLAQIDPRTLQASYDEAAAAKRQNQAQLATARSNYQRSNSAEYRQYVAKTDLDTQRNQVAQFESAVAANEASMRAAQVQLQYTRVTAPISGIAGIRAVDAGNIVSAGTALVTLTQIHPIHVVFNLPERQLPAVRQAQAAGAVAIAALDRNDAHVLTDGGKLDVVDNQISSDSGTFRARALFDNEDNSLWPGQFVNVRMQLRTIAGGVVIPTQAVMRGPDGEYVYIVKPDSTVAMQTVKSGVEVGDSQVQITEGLKGGERVVSEGQFRLKPGAKVTALKPGETPAAPTEAELKAAQQQGGGGRRGGGPR